MRFRTRIQQSGRTATGIQVPEDVVEALGSGKRPPVKVTINGDLDTAPRQVTVPADFGAALDAEPAAWRTYDGLSYSNKSWHVLQIEGAKTAETRQRRIAKSVNILKEGRTR
ncbi:hypothetical protein BH20ACT7_BH20ACT7_18220 [soil metagenome]